LTKTPGILGCLLGLALGFACAGQNAAPKGSSASEAWKLSDDVQSCVTTGPEQCFNATDDNCNGVIDEGCGVRTGLIQLAIAWKEPEVDVDLWVIDPAGELVEVGQLTESGLTKEQDCPNRSNCFGQNIENVYLETHKMKRGTYRVRIRLENLAGVEPPIEVSFGARLGPRTYSKKLELSEPEEQHELVLKL